MAYPVVNGPYGLRPVNETGGLPFAGSTRMIPIASAYATSLYFGDPVKFTSDGTLITSGLAYNSASAETGGTLGIFLGCEYTPPTGPIYGKIRSQYWPASTVASDAVAYVCDDPNTVFKAAMLSYNSGATTTVGAVAASALGTNLTSVATATNNTGTAANLVGNSNVGLMLASGNVRRTATAPFRIVGFSTDTYINVQQSVATTNTSTSATLSAANASILTGMLVTGTGIAAGTYVAAVSGTSLTLSAAATATGTATLNFAGYPEVLVRWNAGYHAYAAAVAI